MCAVNTAKQVNSEGVSGRGRRRIPSPMQVAEDVVETIKVGPHLGLFAPALAHDTDGLRRRCAHGHGRPNQRRGPRQLLDDLCGEVMTITTSHQLVYTTLDIINLHIMWNKVLKLELFCIFL